MTEFTSNLSDLISSLSEENNRLKAENHHQAAIIAKQNEDFGSSVTFRISKEKETANLMRENFLLEEKIKKLENLISKDSSVIKISSEKEEKYDHQSSILDTLQARIEGLRRGQKKFAQTVNDLNERNRQVLDEKNREIEVLQKENAEVRSLNEENDRLKAENNQQAAIIAKQNEDLDSSLKFRRGQKKFAKKMDRILGEKNRELEVLQKENSEVLADKTDRLRKLNQLLAQTGHQIIEIDSLIISNSELKEKNLKVLTEKLALETHNNALELQLKHLRRTISEYSTKNAKEKKTAKRKSSSGMVPIPKKNRRKIIVQSDDE